MNFRDWCTDKIVNIIVVLAFLFFILFVIFVAGISNNFQAIDASTNALSTKKIGWGIKREDNHEQPDLGSTNKKIIDEFNGMAMGNKDEKLIYLTFDVGYEGGYTEKILDVLKDNSVPATFFITGHYVDTSEDLIRRMIDEGHIIGNHTPKSLMSDNLKVEEM